jgi:beta propeller repeat protein
MRTRTREMFVILVLVPGLFYGVLTARSAFIGDTDEFAISKNPYDQKFPAIYGDYVVWQDNRNGNWDIYGYNLARKEEFQITTDSEDQKNPALYENFVVWEDYRDDKNAIYGYNLSQQEEFPIAVGSGWKCFPAIFKNTVVWTDPRNGNFDIYGYDLSTSKEVQITTDPQLQQKPALYENIVVWEDYRHDEFAIYGYDLATDEEFRISGGMWFSSPFVDDLYDVAIYGDIVVWMDDSWKSVTGYNLSTSKKFRIAAASLNDCTSHSFMWDEGRRPAIYGDIVIWIDCRNGNEDIYGYSISRGEEFQVIAHESRQRSPAIYEDYVVWQDNRNDNWDIYGCRLLLPFRTVGSTRTKIVLFDYSWIFLLVAVMAIGIAGTWRNILHTRKFDRSRMQTEVWDFRRSKARLFSFYYFGIFGCIFGILYLSLEFVLGILWLVIALFWGINYFWIKKIPFIRITKDEIMVFKDPMHKPEIIKWSDIQKINVQTWTDIPYKLELSLSNGKKTKIDISPIVDEQKEDFIRTLKQFIREDQI